MSVLLLIVKISQVSMREVIDSVIVKTSFSSICSETKTKGLMIISSLFHKISRVGYLSLIRIRMVIYRGYYTVV